MVYWKCDKAFIYMKKMHQMHKMLQKGRKCQPEIIKKKQQICCELGQKIIFGIVKPQRNKNSNGIWDFSIEESFCLKLNIVKKK